MKQKKNRFIALRGQRETQQAVAPQKLCVQTQGFDEELYSSRSRSRGVRGLPSSPPGSDHLLGELFWLL